MIKTDCFIACTLTHTHSHIVRYANAHEHTYVDVASLSLGKKTQPHRILLKRGLQAYSFLLCTYFHLHEMGKTHRKKKKQKRDQINISIVSR